MSFPVRISNKFLLLTVLLLTIFVILYVIEPFIIDHERENWSQSLSGKLDNFSEEIQSSFLKEESELLDELKIFKTLSSTENFPGDQAKAEFRSAVEENFRVMVFNENGDALFWTSNVKKKFPIYLLANYNAAESFFYENELEVFLSVFDTVTTDSGMHIIVVSKLFNKKYKLNTQYYKLVSFFGKLSGELKTELKIIYDSNTDIIPDGRQSLLELRNINGSKVASVLIAKPSLDYYLTKLSNNFQSVRMFVLLFLFLSVGIKYWKYFSNIRFTFIRIVVSGIYLLVLRYLLLETKIIDGVFHDTLGNSEFFASSLGGGIVSSPLELFVSVLFLLAFTIMSSGFILEAINRMDDLILSKFFAIISSILILLVFLLTMRGMGSAARSMIYDSSFFYFKDFSILPASPVLLMDLNVLLVSTCSVIAGALLLLMITKLLRPIVQSLPHFTAGEIFFAGLLIATLVFDWAQRDPQGNWITNMVYASGTFFTYLFIRKNRRVTTAVFSFAALSSSVFSILLLLHFNGKIEEDSLKRTVHELVRPSINWMGFNVGESMNIIQSDESIQELFLNPAVNPSAILFRLWSQTTLQSESINSEIKVLDTDLTEISSFNFDFPEVYAYKPNGEMNPAEFVILKEEHIERGKNIIRGISPVLLDDELVGYIVISVLYDREILLTSEPLPFLSKQNELISSILNLRSLNVIEFSNDSLSFKYGEINSGRKLYSTLLNQKFGAKGDAVFDYSQNGADYRVYAKLVEQGDAVHKIFVLFELKDFILKMFDFFKIFFIHSIFLALIGIGFIVISLTRRRILLSEMRYKLLGSFLLVAIVPLILLAVYVKNLTENKNNDAIYYKLKKRAVSIEEYLNVKGGKRYSDWDRASEDLGIDYSVFQLGDQIYASRKFLYDSEFLPTMMHPEAMHQILINAKVDALVIEKIENYPVSVLYHRAKIHGEEFIIKISTAFNKILLPMTGTELNALLFGMYSLALILIIVISSLLSNQISAPITKLTQASRAVAMGDLNLEIKGSYSGEMRDLVQNFNKMVSALKRSQRQLAEIERESAWKEMAKQVAHEIKNPLTPMKLSIQQLDAAFRDKSPKFGEYFEKVSKTLISQIDTLKNIASEFSSFARMPNIKLERMPIDKIVMETCGLFENEGIDIKIKLNSDKTAFVNIDPEQTSRILINLIRNAEQAGADEITIESEVIVNNLRLNVSDNGKGISEEIQGKIFEDEFSTKQSGMGIGLTMARKYIESIGGKIWVESSSDEGTLIIIEIPLAQ